LHKPINDANQFVTVFLLNKITSI